MKIIIADGHQLVREATVCLLRSTMPGIIVESAGTGAEAMNQYADHTPDVLVTELLLPDYSGLELCKRVRQRWSRANVVFLSSIDDVSMVKQALLLGAQGYLSKNCRPAELAMAIKKSTEGEVYLEHELATQLAVVQMGSNGFTNNMSNRLSDMTQREVEILILIARGLSSHNVAERLNISVKTVANHLSILKGKLEVSSTLELLHFAVDSGLVQYGLKGSAGTALPN